MAEATISVDMPNLLSKVTLHVRFARQRQVVARLVPMLWLIRFAAWLGGLGGVTIEGNDGSV